MSNKIKDIDSDISGWYTEVVTKADLADYGPVKGTIKPIWIFSEAFVENEINNEKFNISKKIILIYLLILMVV